MEGVEKRGLFVFGILVLFIIMLAGFSEAVVTCSDPSQVILRLSSATNAHGEIFADPGLYTEDICYNTIFGVLGSGDRTCTGSNKVVGLSSSTNAHAEEPSLSNYATDVCYEGLSCTARTGACLSGESLVLSLSSSTNAHLTSGSSYSQNICCTAGPPPPTYCGDGTVQTPNDDGQNEECDGATNCISSGEVNECQCEPGFVSDGSGGCEASSCSITSASWSFNGEIVTEVTEETPVDMIITGNNCGGTDINFEIWENDFLFDDLVITINGNFDTLESWTTTWTYEGDDDLGQDPRDYYFKAMVAGTSESEKSSTLAVSRLDPLYCNPVTVCEDYYTHVSGDPTAENACNIDATLCEVAEFSVELIRDDDSFCENDDITCLCGWDVTISSCYTTWEEIETPDCGNNIREGEEVCDGSDLDGYSCTNFDEYPGGTLVCKSDCSGFITDQCTGYSCNNNGTREVGEACDGNDLDGYSCTDFDEFTGGTLLCDSSCDFDMNQCFKDDDDGPPTVVGRCVYTSTTSGSCETDGFLSSSWTAEWFGDPTSPRRASCVDGQNVIECPAQIQLAFFNLYNMLITLLAIAGIYGIISLRKKH